ncbi:hypothetical protein ACPC54_02920 [Kitasatospora sp. NPDC094028]
MISMRPVLEVHDTDGFSLWPTAAEPTGQLVLDGRLTPEQVGTAVHRLAELNDVDPEPAEERGPRPADPLGAFLHGLLTMDLYITGGLYVTDPATGTVFEPGCCYGLEEWRDWHRVVDGSGVAWFGHDPQTIGEAPRAARLGRLVRLTQAPDDPGSPVIELSLDELRRLLAGVERDLGDFLRLVARWAERQLPGHAAAVTAALARALELRPAEEPAP